jgi:hypothetical protein
VSFGMAEPQWPLQADAVSRIVNCGQISGDLQYWNRVDKSGIIALTEIRRFNTSAR